MPYMNQIITVDHTGNFLEAKEYTALVCIYVFVHVSLYTLIMQINREFFFIHLSIFPFLTNPF